MYLLRFLSLLLDLNEVHRIACRSESHPTSLSTTRRWSLASNPKLASSRPFETDSLFGHSLNVAGYFVRGCVKQGRWERFNKSSGSIGRVAITVVACAELVLAELLASEASSSSSAELEACFVNVPKLQTRIPPPDGVVHLVNLDWGAISPLIRGKTERENSRATKSAGKRRSKICTTVESVYVPYVLLDILRKGSHASSYWSAGPTALHWRNLSKHLSQLQSFSRSSNRTTQRQHIKKLFAIIPIAEGNWKTGSKRDTVDGWRRR